MTIFDWIGEILVNKKPWDSFSEEEQKTFNAFIINRWLSMDAEFIEIVNYFQKYAIGTLEPREVYMWYRDVLPKGKRFNKYIKGKKSKKYDGEFPIRYWKEFLDYLDITEKEFWYIADKYRRDLVWEPTKAKFSGYSPEAQYKLWKLKEQVE